MAKLTNEEIIASLKEMTIIELNDLVKAIEEEFGVTAAAPVAGPAVVVEEAVADQGPTEVDVVLTEIGDAKVAVIKAVREATGLGLVEAKGLVDKVPAVIKEKVKVEEADKIKEILMAAGAVVEYK